MRSIVRDRVAWSVYLSVGRSVTLVSPAKTAEPIEVPYELRTWVGPRDHVLVHRVSKKLCKFFLSELVQIFTNFDNFWHKDGKDAKIM